MARLMNRGQWSIVGVVAFAVAVGMGICFSESPNLAVVIIAAVAGGVAVVCFGIAIARVE